MVLVRHHDVDDLRRKLSRFPEANKLIVTEGVFVLEGRILDLASYVEIARGYDAMLMLDDAHGIGLLGPSGGGICEKSPFQGGVDLYMACMDKALGGTGGFLCGSSRLMRCLRATLRSSILSSCLPAMMAGAMRESVKIAREQPERRCKAIELAGYVKERLRGAGLTVLGEICHPSVSLLSGDDLKGIEVSNALRHRGILIPIMRWPAVPANQSRLRINLSCGHTSEQVERLIDALMECCA